MISVPEVFTEVHGAQTAGAREMMTVMRIRTKLAAVALAVTVPSAVAAVTAAPHAAAASPLVYVCTAQPCAGAQEFEVFDAYGNPVYSVGEYGGDAVFGDNRSVFAPGSVTRPVLVESFASPAVYAKDEHVKAACRAPETWIEPHGIWYCTSSGTWARDLSIP